MNNIRVCLASDPELREEFLEMAGFIADLNLKLSTYDQGILMDKWMFCPDGGNREQLRQGLFSEAEDSFRRAIGILEMILEEKADEQILQGYGNLMKLYTKMGEAEKADEMKKKIAELRALSRGDKTE